MGCPLFCTVANGQALISELMSIPTEPGAESFLVETKQRWLSLPSERQRDHDKLRLAPGKHFTTDFLGASAMECAQCKSDHQEKFDFIWSDAIVVVDERSLRDHTASILSYCVAEGVYDFPPYGLLPPDGGDRWCEWRVRVDEHIEDALTSLSGMVEPDVWAPIYYGHRATFTDESGIFDVKEAQQALENPKILPT